MKIDDVEAVSRVAVSAFMDSVADGLSKEGIATFLSLSAPESFAARMNEDIHMLVCEINDELIGMVELKEGRHVAMLFVVPAAQKRGIGRALVKKSTASESR